MGDCGLTGRKREIKLRWTQEPYGLSGAVVKRGALHAQPVGMPLSAASSLEGNQPPRLPSSFCSWIFSASMSMEALSAARPRCTPLSSHSVRAGLCRHRERSVSDVKTIATVSGWLSDDDGIWTQWKQERNSDPTMCAFDVVLFDDVIATCAIAATVLEKK